MLLLASVKKSLDKKLPKRLVEKLLEHYKHIKSNSTFGKHENTELNASKFSEIVYRIIDYGLNGTYIPLGKQIHNFTDKCRQLEQHPSHGIDDSLRIHIPRTLILIVDIRNKRGVGHVSGIHNPNLLDSTLVTRCCDWILAELIRLFNDLTIDEAQKIVERLVSTDLSLIAKIGPIKRVLKEGLTYPQQVLLLLYNEFPLAIKDKTLFEWVEHSNFSAFKRDVLVRLHRKRFIEYGKDENCLILPPGRSDLEAKILKIK